MLPVSVGAHVDALAGAGGDAAVGVAAVVVAQRALAGAGQLQLRGGPSLRVPRPQEGGGRRLLALVWGGAGGVAGLVLELVGGQTAHQLGEVPDGEAALLLVPGVGVLDGDQLVVLLLGLQPAPLPLAEGAEDAADPVLEGRGEVGLGVARVLECGAAPVAPVLGGRGSLTCLRWSPESSPWSRCC